MPVEAQGHRRRTHKINRLRRIARARGNDEYILSRGADPPVTVETGTVPFEKTFL